MAEPTTEREIGLETERATPAASVAVPDRPAPDAIGPAPAASVAARSPLTRERDFLILLFGEGTSAIGDAVSFTALPILVLALTGSGFAMGVVGALQTIPDLVIGLVAGAVADRSDRRRLMLVGNLGRAILVGLIPLSALLRGPTMTVILLVAAPISVLRSFFLAGYTAAIPAIVGRPRLAQANSYLEAVYSMGFIIGPAVAGVLAAIVGPGTTIAIDAASFLLAGSALLFVRSDLRAPADRPQMRLVHEIRTGIDYVRHAPTLRDTILFWGAVSVAGAGLIPAMTVYVTRELGESSASLGLLFSAYGIGTVLGALVASRIRRGRAWPQLLGGNLGRALSLIAIAFVARVEIDAALAFGAGLCSSFVLITYITLRTAYSPDHLLGRIGSTARTISLGMQPLGMLAAGALIDLTSGSTTLAVMGGLMVLLSLVAAPLSSLRAATLNPRPGDGRS